MELRLHLIPAPAGANAELKLGLSRTRLNHKAGWITTSFDARLQCEGMRCYKKANTAPLMAWLLRLIAGDASEMPWPLETSLHEILKRKNPGQTWLGQLLGGDPLACFERPSGRWSASKTLAGATLRIWVHADDEPMDATGLLKGRLGEVQGALNLVEAASRLGPRILSIELWTRRAKTQYTPATKWKRFDPDSAMPLSPTHELKVKVINADGIARNLAVLWLSPTGKTQALWPWIPDTQSNPTGWEMAHDPARHNPRVEVCLPDDWAIKAKATPKVLRVVGEGSADCIIAFTYDPKPRKPALAMDAHERFLQALKSRLGTSPHPLGEALSQWQDAGGPGPGGFAATRALEIKDAHDGDPQTGSARVLMERVTEWLGPGITHAHAVVVPKKTTGQGSE